jgi:hypothetical protein
VGDRFGPELPSGLRAPRTAPGRVEPEWVPDSAPGTCHSQALCDKNFEHAVEDGLWPGLPVHSRVRQLTLAGRAHGSKVSFLAWPRTHTGGHFQSYDRSGNWHANDRFQSAVTMGRRPLEGPDSPKQSAALVVFPYAAMCEQLELPGDEGLENLLQFIVGRSCNLDNDSDAVGSWVVQAVRCQAAQVDV